MEGMRKKLSNTGCAAVSRTGRTVGKARRICASKLVHASPAKSSNTRKPPLATYRCSAATSASVGRQYPASAMYATG